IARWVRAVKDRSLKMLYIRCFFQDDKRFIENLVNFNLDYLNKTVKELNSAGFKVAANSTECMNEPRHLVGRLSPFEILAAGLALLLGFPILLRISFWETLGGNPLLAYVLANIGAFFIFPSTTFVAASGLVGAVSYSCIGVILAMNGLDKMRSRSFFAIMPGFVAKMVLPSVFGGILIAGLYSEIEYLLKFEQFRGIKLAFMLPLLITGLWSLKKYGRGVFGLLHRPVNPLGVMLLSVVAAGTVLYLLRSGNATFLKPSEMEDAFRTFLENTLVARPRNKEFLVGYPAGLLFIFFFLRQNYQILPLLAIFMQMGQVSVVNSLCHFHTPLYLSLLRVVNGFWLGILVGVAAVVLVAFACLLLVVSAAKKKTVFIAGYFGFGNFGDELLWQTFSQRFLERFADYRIVLLHSGKNMPVETALIQPVSRRSVMCLLEELCSCEVFVVPGGGVFQSVTSVRSLLYYLVLMTVARIAGARVILPAQGLGPWGKEGKISSVILEWLAHELCQAKYLSLRDAGSADTFKQIAPVESAPTIATDLVFLNENIGRKSLDKPAERLRVHVVLRSSVKESERIARELIAMAEELENLELYPVSFQPQEDEKVWFDAGWKGKIFYPDSPEEVFANADLVISMRLHGCIIAAKAGIPWVGIAYDPKVSAFAVSNRWALCCMPEEADRKYFEEKINLVASDMAKTADKLNRISRESVRVAEEDFRRMCAAVSQKD
ncbi:MAG: DUF5693 family protein, partial [Candidatus Riflebacteria bacterium]|nr:DUF5693 family protein [Candidatus Riflebacteria bacterium]